MMCVCDVKVIVVVFGIVYWIEFCLGCFGLFL